VAHADGEGLEGHVGPLVAREIERRPDADAARSDWFHAASRVLRSAHGVPCRMDRLRCLGNAVVPQVAEVIGRAILELESVAS
jgi:DNA (cytosine-5)-methyltransferase 1